MNNEKESLKNAYNKKRIFDQMTSMHFKLSDIYKVMSKIEDTVEIIISVLLCGFTFFSFEKFGCQRLNNPTLIIGLMSIFLFAFTLVKQRLDHKKLSEQHYLAGKMYARAKLEVDAKIKEWETMEIEEIEILQYLHNNFSELNDLAQIPEKHFNRLKHVHQTKVEFSKFLDTHKRDYFLICRLKFRFGKNK